METLHATSKKLQQLGARHGSVLVSYSGGKDSKVVLDLCSRHFRRVECFYMYLVPGLQYVEGMLTEAFKRYGVRARQYPHWILPRLLSDEIFCDNRMVGGSEIISGWKLRDIYDQAIEDAGCEIIVTGYKKADGLWRRRGFDLMKHWEDVIHPIMDWTTLEVQAYLISQDLPLPRSEKKSTGSGLDLTTPALLWFYDNHPRDFEKLERTFRYIRAVIYRREWYGVGA